jgi:hypothetical protein
MTRTETLPPAARDRNLAALAEAMETESRLLVQLASTLGEQRRGVAEDDIQRVDDSVQATHRILETLAEARNRRNMLVQLLTDLTHVPIPALADALGERMTDQLRDRQQALESTARTLSRDVKLNRILLEKALKNGDRHVRGLLRPITPAVTYGGHGQPGARGEHAALINRRV